MKVYFHLNLGGFSNCYIVANEKLHEAILIDPGYINTSVIENIELGGYKLVCVLISHNHGSHVEGLTALRKIYTPKIFAADWEVAKNDTTVLQGDGTFRAAGLKVEYFSLPGHASDCMVYKIGDVMFTGDSICAGTIGPTDTKFSKRTLIKNINAKIFSQTDETVIMPGHGPPTTVGVERKFNSYLK